MRLLWKFPTCSLAPAVLALVVTAAGGCAVDDDAGPAGRGFGATGDKADGDGDAIYGARRIYRGCQGDGCSGLELSRLHHATTPCEDGSYQRACFVADGHLDWSATGIDPVRLRTLLTLLPVGTGEGLTLPPMPLLLRAHREADGDDLAVTEVWEEQVPGLAPRTELVGVVEGDDGALREQVLNRPGVRTLDLLTYPSLDDREARLLMDALADGVIVGADDDTSPDGSPTRRLYQFWTRHPGR